MPRQTRILDSESQVTELISTWIGVVAEVIVRGHDSDAWLARFAGTVEKVGPGGHVNIDIGGPEAWVQTVPLGFEDAVLYDNGVLVVRHRDGETTIRTESATLSGGI